MNLGQAVTEEISEDLKRRLDWVMQSQAVDRRDEVTDLLQDELLPSDIRTCAWWDGCYYCKDEQGEWHNIRCIA